MNRLTHPLFNLAIALFTATGFTSSFAGTTSASQQASATVAAVCTISAQNLSFGALTLPLSAQSASTTMNVLCSKNHAYTVGLAYGGVYGQGGPTEYYAKTLGYPAYYVYNSSGKQIGTATSLPSNAVYQQANSYDGDNLGQWTVNASYGYGKMTGVASGDSIGYFIQVPGQPGQVWNTGNYTYSDTGTGVNQSLPVTGTLVPAQSGSSYPTPDMYMDTVTATVTF